MNAEFSLGSVINRTFSIYAKNFVAFTLISFGVLLPLALFMYFNFMSLADPKIRIAVQAMETALTFVAQGAITYGVVLELHGRHVGLAQCLSVGLARLLPIFGVALLVGLAVGVGLLLFIIPGVILMCCLYVAVPATVVEKAGVSDAMSRSFYLTGGHRWQIFGVLVVLFIIALIVNAALTFLALSLVSKSIMGFILIAFVASAISSSLGAVAAAVAYNDLRAVKEGVDTEELAAVFE